MRGWRLNRENLFSVFAVGISYLATGLFFLAISIRLMLLESSSAQDILIYTAVVATALLVLAAAAAKLRRAVLMLVGKKVLIVTETGLEDHRGFRTRTVAFSDIETLSPPLDQIEPPAFEELRLRLKIDNRLAIHTKEKGKSWGQSFSFFDHIEALPADQLRAVSETVRRAGVEQKLVSFDESL